MQNNVFYERLHTEVNPYKILAGVSDILELADIPHDLTSKGQIILKPYNHIGTSARDPVGYTQFIRNGFNPPNLPIYAGERELIGMQHGIFTITIGHVVFGQVNAVYIKFPIMETEQLIKLGIFDRVRKDNIVQALRTLRLI